MISEYEPCFQCGDYVDGIQWSGVVEYSTKRNEQSCSISCSNCNVSIHITADPDRLDSRQSHIIEDLLRTTWNTLYRACR